jgi:hypothetical protein
MQTNRFKITLHTSQGQFEELITGESIELGRNISADLPVMASGVSRSHLKVYVIEGKIRLKDLGSTNGTYIKGVRVEPHKEVVYENGTRVSLGQAGCFIRIELASDDVKIEEDPLQEREGSYTKTKAPQRQQTNVGVDESSLMDSLFGKPKGTSDSSDKRIQKRAQAQMEEAEKLIKKRIAEAEASIRRGIQKARIQAKDIKSEAGKEAETIKIKAQVEKNRMLSELDEEISKQKSKIIKDANEIKIATERDLAKRQSDLESEVSLAQGQVKKDIREAEALVNGAKTEVEALNIKQKKLNDEIKDLLEQKNLARQKFKEVEVKLDTIDEAHEVKSKALESELLFLKKEIDKNKASLESLLLKNEEATKEHSEKISKTIEQTIELSKTLDQVSSSNEQFKIENEGLEQNIEELNIQLKHKKNKLEEAKTETDRLLHQRDELEDLILKTKEAEELRMYEFKNQIELDAKKTVAKAQREADLLAHESETEREQSLKNIEKIREEENLKIQELRKQVNIEANLIKTEAQKSADEMIAKATAQKNELLEKNEVRLQEQDLKIKEDRKQAALEVKEIKLDAQRRADFLITKARVERENLLKKTEERLEGETLKIKEFREQSEFDAKEITAAAKKRADLLISTATDEQDALLIAANKKLSEAESRAESINKHAVENEKKLTENAEKLHREASEIKRGAAKAFEEAKQQVLDQALIEKKEMLESVVQLKNEASTEKKEIIANAHKEKEILLKESKEKFKQAEEEYKSKMSEFEGYKKIEAKKLEDHLEEQSYIGKNNLESELADIKFTRTKEIEEQIRILKTYRAEYAESWSTAIVFKAQEIFSSKLSEEENVKARDDLKEFAKAVINEENPDEQSEVQNLMKFDPVHREKKKKLFKKQMAFAALGVFALMLSPYISKSFKEKAQQVAESNTKATKERVAKFEEEREKLTAFVPVQINEYLETYTDRVLYTPDYVKNELSSEYREEWFLNLDTFFVEELILSDEAIVTFISKETNLIKDLQTLREGINAQFIEKGVERMQNIEKKFLADVKMLLKNEEKFARFDKFKKDYYLKSFPFDAERSLATESTEDAE